MPISLNQVVSTYIQSWEGHTQTEGQNYIKLRNKIESSTIDEINTEYNALTQQELWVDPVIDIFYDELLNRIMNGTTFAISTAYRSVSDWIQNPFVVTRVSFEESYPVIDTDGTLILPDDPTISSFTLLSDSFLESQRSHIIRLILHETVVTVVEVSEVNQRLQIVAIEQPDNPDNRIIVPNQRPIGGRFIRTKAKINQTPDWNMVRQMYQALQKSQPTVIDPYADRLINQLIDINEVEDIIDERGLTHEGDLIIEVRELEEHEERVEIL